jgi:polysaccharide biosynthesis transport protein
LTGSDGLNDAPAAEPAFVETEVPVGEIASITAAFLSVESEVGEGLRAVGTRLRLGWKGKEFRTLALTSCVEGDGKTSVALGLAAAFAHAGQRVIVMDADLRRRDVAATLGIEPVAGLAEWLEKGQNLLPLRRVAGVGFHLLSAGIGPCRPELLGTPRFTQLLSVAQRHSDLVLLDCAPLLPVADSLALRDQVEGFLMVVRARHSPREAVSRATALLGRRRIVGIVMNAYRSLVPMRKGYGYGYGTYRYSSTYKYPGSRRLRTRAAADGSGPWDDNSA